LGSHIQGGRGHRLILFENRTLRKILGTRWVKVTGDWRKLPKGCFMTFTPWSDARMEDIYKDLEGMEWESVN
jgi:hypothetical protein